MNWAERELTSPKSPSWLTWLRHILVFKSRFTSYALTVSLWHTQDLLILFSLISSSTPDVSPCASVLNTGQLFFLQKVSAWFLPSLLNVIMGGGNFSLLAKYLLECIKSISFSINLRKIFAQDPDEHLQVKMTQLPWIHKVPRVEIINEWRKRTWGHYSLMSNLVNVIRLLEWSQQFNASPPAFKLNVWHLRVKLRIDYFLNGYT